MKDLSNLPSVVKALSQVVADSTVTDNNGTAGIELLCHYWDYDIIKDENRRKIEAELAKAVLNKDIELANAFETDLKRLPSSEKLMIFRLLEPITHLQGTKVMYDGEKSYSPVMKNVQFLYIAEMSIKMGLLEYEETGEMAADKLGKETPVIKLKLKKGIIDVSAAIYDRNKRMIREARAYVTPVSYRSMQVAGKIIAQEREVKRKLYGYDENNI